MTHEGPTPWHAPDANDAEGLQNTGSRLHTHGLEAFQTQLLIRFDRLLTAMAEQTAAIHRMASTHQELTRAIIEHEVADDELPSTTDLSGRPIRRN